MYCIKHISMYLCTGPVYIHKLTNIHVHANHVVCNNFQYLEVWCSTKVFLLEKSCWWRKHIGAVLETGKKNPNIPWHKIPVISLIIHFLLFIHTDSNLPTNAAIWAAVLPTEFTWSTLAPASSTCLVTSVFPEANSPKH